MFRIILAILLIASTAYADLNPAAKWQTVDGTVSGRARTIVVSNDTISFTGNVMSLDTTKSGAASIWTDGGTNAYLTNNEALSVDSISVDVGIMFGNAFTITGDTPTVDGEVLSYDSTTGGIRWGTVASGAGGNETLAQTLALGADANDVDTTSWGKMEGFDAGLYLDWDADGVIDLTSDGTLELHSNDWDIDTTGIMTNMGAITMTVGNLTISDGEIWCFDDGNNPRVLIGDDSGSGNYGYLQWNSANDYFQMSEDGTNALRIDASNVSTGNIFPGAPLTIGNGTQQLLNCATTGVTTIGGAGLDGQVEIYSEQGGTDYAVVLQPHATMTATTTYQLPPDDGDAGEQLQTDGGGALTWEASGAISSVTEGVAGPLVIVPNTGAVTVSIASADATTDGYITGAQYEKIEIISSDSATQDTKLAIISADAVDWENNRVSKDAVLGQISVDDVVVTEEGHISFDSVLASDHTGTGIITSMTVDANTIGVASALHLDTDGNWIEADADAEATMPCGALALETGTGTKKVLMQGFIRDDTWVFNPGGIVYVSADVGKVSQTVPSGTGDQVQAVGIATHADRMYFNPSWVLVEVA